MPRWGWSEFASRRPVNKPLSDQYQSGIGLIMSLSENIRDTIPTTVRYSLPRGVCENIEVSLIPSITPDTLLRS